MILELPQTPCVVFETFTPKNENEELTPVKLLESVAQNLQKI